MTLQDLDREGFVAVPGGRVWRRICGGDAPGTALLVLHGGPGVPHDYLEVVAAFLRQAEKQPTTAP